MKHVLVLAAIGLALAAAPAAHADVSAAARAFSEGQAAQLEGNYEHAAQSFELAFNIAPSREALRSAVRARQLGGQLPRAATLAQLLLAQYGDDSASVKLAIEVITEARAKLGRVTVQCPTPCSLAIGGRVTSLNAAPSHVVFLAPGTQTLEISFDGDRNATREITLKPGDDVTLPVAAPPVKRAPPDRSPAAPVSAPLPAPARDAGFAVAPYWAIGGAIVTLTLAGITAWSGLDTNSAHDDYVKAPTAQRWNDGQSKQLRTNILLGTSAAAGAATALIAVFWTRWDERPRPHDLAVIPERGGATLSFGGRF